jgi:hypothetical protein
MGRTRFVRKVGEISMEPNGSVTVNYFGRKVSLAEAEEIQRNIEGRQEEFVDYSVLDE